LLLHESLRAAYQDGATWFGEMLARRPERRSVQPF
jgi:hypothetical protein